MACTIAEENAIRNGVSDYRISQGDFTSNSALLQAMINFQADVICANLVADLLIELAPYVKHLLKPGGILIASGIIDEHADRVADTLGLKFVQRLQRDGWTTLKGGF